MSGNTAFMRAKPGGVHAAHLPRADAHGLAVASIHNGVRFDVLAYAPGKQQAAQLFGGGRPPRDHLQLAFGDPAGVGILQKQSSRDVLDHWARRSGVNFDQAQVLLGREALARFRREGRRGDGLNK